jgi:CubicO group peptidase (beta-lactamase class C family)
MPKLPSAAHIDAEVERLRALGKIPAVAVAVIDDGRVVHAAAFGQRDVERGLPLTTTTTMYGASLTKMAFAYMVMQLVDEGVVDLDMPIARLLEKPLPEYEKYADLAGDPRWEKLTPRILLSHRAGFPNYRFINENGKLDIKFDPGTRYAYSGEGMNLLQFVLEKGLHLDVGEEMRRRVFERFGMTRTSLTWREDFADELAIGYDAAGAPVGHERRKSARAAGSMDTTIEDFARFLAGFMRGEGVSPKGRAEILRSQIAIAAAHQFPTMLTEEDAHNRVIGLSAGLGVVVFDGPQGRTFFKGGHDDGADNQAVCVERTRRCVLLLSNSGVGQRIYPSLVGMILGETGVPWGWEYNPVLPIAPQ